MYICPIGNGVQDPPSRLADCYCAIVLASIQWVVASRSARMVGEALGITGPVSAYGKGVGWERPTHAGAGDMILSHLRGTSTRLLPRLFPPSVIFLSFSPISHILSTWLPWS